MLLQNTKEISATGCKQRRGVSAEVLELAEESTIPNPGPGEVRIKVLAAGTGFTDTFIRRGRYPDFKGPLPFTPGYELVGETKPVHTKVPCPNF